VLEKRGARVKEQLRNRKRADTGHI